MTTSPPVTIQTMYVDRAITGYDSAITSIPRLAYVRRGTRAAERVLDMNALEPWLERTSEFMAGSMESGGELLHHADWYVTSDPEFVRDKGLHPDHPDCPSCITAVERALDYLDRGADRAVLVGMLYWAERTEG